MLARIGLLRLVVAAVLGSLVLAASPCFAEWNGEEERPPVDRSLNSIHAGATSVQLLTFGGGYAAPFATSGLYIKTHLSDRYALRVGADFSLKEFEGNAPQPEPPDVSSSENYTVQVSAEIDGYVDATGPVTVFLGAGPYWTRGRSFYERYRYFLYSGIYHEDYQREEFRSWEVGGSATVGFEWFFQRKLSVVGRVGASLGFGKRHESRDSRYGPISNVQADRREIDANTAASSSSNAALGFGLYF